MAPDHTPSDHGMEPTAEVTDYVAAHAPELDPREVATFMEEHPMPADEPGSHLAWAVRVMREVGEGEVGEGLSVDRVVSEIRQGRARGR